jgi:hypothetical protein
MGLERYVAAAGLAGILATSTGCSLVRDIGGALTQYGTNASNNINRNFYDRVYRELRPSYVADSVFYLSEAQSSMVFERAFRYRLENDEEFRKGLESEIKSLISRGAGDALETELKKSEFVRSIMRWFNVDYKPTDPTRPFDEKFKTDPNGPSVLEPEKRKSIDDIWAHVKKNITNVKFGVRVRDLTQDPTPEFSIQWMKMYRIAWRPTEDELKHSIGLTIDKMSVGIYFKHDQQLDPKELSLGIGYSISRNSAISLSASHRFLDEETGQRYSWDDGNSFSIEWFIRF